MRSIYACSVAPLGWEDDCACCYPYPSHDVEILDMVWYQAHDEMNLRFDQSH